MPHVIVKMYAGRSESDKARLADAITQAVMQTLGYGEESVSVALEDVEPRDWRAKVYEPDIVAKPETLYKKPGYSV